MYVNVQTELVSSVWRDLSLYAVYMSLWLDICDMTHPLRRLMVGVYEYKKFEIEADFNI